MEPLQWKFKPACNWQSFFWQRETLTMNVLTARILRWMVCRSSSWTTLARSEMDMHQCWTATQPTLPASLQRSPPRSIAVQERSLRLPPSSSRTEMLHMSRWCQASPCAWRPSPPTHPWDVSPSVTWGRQSLSESSRLVLFLLAFFDSYLLSSQLLQCSSWAPVHNQELKSPPFIICTKTLVICKFATALCCPLHFFFMRTKSTVTCKCLYFLPENDAVIYSPRTVSDFAWRLHDWLPCFWRDEGVVVISQSRDHCWLQSFCN